MSSLVAVAAGCTMSGADELSASSPDSDPVDIPVTGTDKTKGRKHRDGDRGADTEKTRAHGSKISPTDTIQPTGAKRMGAKPPGAKSVGWALVQAARLHRSRIGDRLAGLGLFAGQEQVVQALAASGTMTMGDLAAVLRVRPPTASKTISRLAALGFVERRAESGDGRVVRVRLTETGLAKAEAIERLWKDVEAELLAGFDGKERRRLRKLLRKAARGLAEAAGLTGHETEADAEIEAEEADDEAPLAVPPA